jgi:hypothetical protein
MRYDKYIVVVGHKFMTYDFISEGSKGSILKRVQFQSIGVENFYNLAFGDVNAETNEIDDTVVSNNNDSEKVLATVANTVTIFTKQYPNAIIIATGSTPSRTRLYKIGISKNIEEIKETFEVFGLDENGKWAEFERDIPYSAFYLTRKI